MPARQSPMGEVYNPSRIGNHQTRPTDTANRERWWYRWYRLRSRSRGWRGLRGWSEKRRMLVGSDTTTLSDRAWCDGTDFRFEETAETSFLQRFAGSLSNAWNGSDTILDWTLPGLLHRCCALESRDLALAVLLSGWEPEQWLWKPMQPTERTQKGSSCGLMQSDSKDQS